MANDETPQHSATRSISTLIAWLSVCMLAAAWGSSSGPEWALSWMQWGAFGLVAAVGLNVGDRMRSARRHRAEEKAAIDRLERRLSTVVDDDEVLHKPSTASDRAMDGKHAASASHG